MSSIRILYFGRLKDAVGHADETLDWAGGTTGELLAQLRGRGEAWAGALAEGQAVWSSTSRSCAATPTSRSGRKSAFCRR